MEMHNYFGMKCNSCGSTFEMIISDSTPKCSNCGDELVANSNSTGAHVNFNCDKCGYFAALLIGEHSCSTLD